MAKRFGYNLLAFVYFSSQHRGTAKLVLKKSTCKTIIKLYKKSKNLQMSDKVKTISNFLNSNAVCKISVSSDELSVPNNLIDEIGFVLIEQWEQFLQWSKIIKNGLIVTVTKNIKLGDDWIGTEDIFMKLEAIYAINHKDLGMNTIIFNNGYSYEQDWIKQSAKGFTKIILTPKLWKEMRNLSNTLEVSQFLRNEQTFCYLALEPNSSRILSYAFDEFATLIFNNKIYVDDAFVKFKVGVVLEFAAVVHEQFQLQQISGMKVNSLDLK